MAYLQIITETILVGIYTTFIFHIITNITKTNFIVLLLVVGFLKHFLGYYLQFHKWYCNNGYACNNKKKEKETEKDRKITLFHLIIESIIESLSFFIIGLLLHIIIYDNLYLLYFLIGIILHLLSELFGFHKYFCKNKL
jgi:hypothetical protein